MEIVALAPFFAARPVLACAVLFALAMLRCWSVGVGDACSDDPVVYLLLLLPAAFLESVVRAFVHRVRTLLDEVFAALQRVLEILHVIIAIGCAVSFIGHALWKIVTPPAIGSSESEALVAIDSVGFALGVAASALLVGFVSIARLLILRALTTADPDNALRLRGPIAFFEIAFTIAGVAATVLFPSLGVVLAALVVATALALTLVVRQLRADRTSRCAACSDVVDVCALSCKCGHAVALPRDVGVLGMPRRRVIDVANDTFRARHARRLVLAGRCARCATPLAQRAVDKGCPSCGAAVLVDATSARDVAAESARAAPLALAVAFAAALIPIAGLPLAVVVVRLSRAGGLRRWLSPSGRLFAGGMRVVVLLLVPLLIVVQPVPLLGAGAVALALGAALALDRALFLRAR